MANMKGPYPAPRGGIFQDPADQASFDQGGYVIRDFLNAGEIRHLNDLFMEIVRQGCKTYDPFKDLTYYISVFDQDSGRRKSIDSLLKEMFRDKIDTMLHGYRILQCNFMAKEPGRGEIQVHQDFTFVDEDRFTGFNLWVPLVDTDENNGCFCMLPGSNQLLRSYRASSIPDTLTRYNDALKRRMIPKPLKAGKGIIFDHRLFHYSADNLSDRWRPAIQLLVIPKDTQAILLQYDKADPEHLTVRKLNDEYLCENNLWEPPSKLEAIGSKPYIPLPDERELIQMAEGLWQKHRTTAGTSV